MIEIQTTRTFDKSFLKLPPKIQVRAAQRTELFKSNPFHPSLKTEKLSPKGFDVWSFRVDFSYRIVFKFISEGVAEFRFKGAFNSIIFLLLN